MRFRCYAMMSTDSAVSRCVDVCYGVLQREIIDLRVQDSRCNCSDFESMKSGCAWLVKPPGDTRVWCDAGRHGISCAQRIATKHTFVHWASASGISRLRLASNSGQQIIMRPGADYCVKFSVGRHICMRAGCGHSDTAASYFDVHRRRSLEAKLLGDPTSHVL